MKAMGRRHLLRAVMQVLPKRLRFAYLRKAIKVLEQDPPEGLEFKIAETQEEMEQAYQILHDSYVEAGYQEPTHHGMRITKYFALPTTTTLVAKWNNKVIGTMSIIRKSPLGLPIESVFDISGVVAGGKTVAEVSSLAISSEFRHRRGTLFLPLCKFFYLYIKKYMHLDRVVIAVNPAWKDFYEGILDFSSLESRVIGSYDFANGAPAVGLWSDVTTWEERFISLYGNKPPKQNLYQYFVEKETMCLQFPNRDYEKAMDPVMTPEMLDYFFNKKSSVFKDLSAKEVLTLHSFYPQKSYAHVLPVASSKGLRKSARFIVDAAGQADYSKTIRVLEVSESGLKLQGPLPRRTLFNLSVQVSQGQIARLKAMIHWIDQDNNSYGVEIVGHDEVWEDYIQYLDADFSNILPIELARLIGKAS